MDKPLCVVCTRRLARFVNAQVCRKCRARLDVEDAWGQYGLTKPRVKEISDKAFFTKYNKLAGLGLTQPQIAETLNIPQQTVKNRKAILTRQGYEFTELRYPRERLTQPSEPKQVRNPNANEHGGGKCGVWGCNCELCIPVRRKYRSEWAAANPGKMKAYRQKYERDKRNRTKPS